MTIRFQIDSNEIEVSEFYITGKHGDKIYFYRLNEVFKNRLLQANINPKILFLKRNIHKTLSFFIFSSGFYFYKNSNINNNSRENKIPLENHYNLNQEIKQNNFLFNNQIFTNISINIVFYLDLIRNNNLKNKKIYCKKPEKNELDTVSEKELELTDFYLSNLEDK